MVDHRDVKSFQSHLTQLARYRASVGEPTWREAYQSEVDVLKMSLNLMSQVMESVKSFSDVAY